MEITQSVAIITNLADSLHSVKLLTHPSSNTGSHGWASGDSVAGDASKTRNESWKHWSSKLWLPSAKDFIKNGAKYQLWGIGDNPTEIDADKRSHATSNLPSKNYIPNSCHWSVITMLMIQNYLNNTAKPNRLSTQEKVNKD